MLNGKFTLTILFGLDPALAGLLTSSADKLKGEIMAKVKDLLDDLRNEVQAATNRIQTDVSGLKAQVAELQAKIDSGEATPEVAAEIAELKDQIKALDPTDSTVLPDPTADPNA